MLADSELFPALPMPATPGSVALLRALSVGLLAIAAAVVAPLRAVPMPQVLGTSRRET